MQRRPVVIRTVFILLLVTTATAAQAGNLDRYVEKQMARARVPGLAAAFLVDGELAWAKGYGWADIANEVPVTADTLFLIGSVSKPVTTTGILRLKDQRRVDLDEDVNRYLPFEVRNPAYPDEPITLRQLLTHTSSISDAQSELSAIWWDLVTVGDYPGSMTQFLADYLTPGGQYYDPPGCFNDAAPGTRWEYSNVGFTLVGAVVEHVTGLSFEEFQQRSILGPLEMNESSWLLENLDPARVAVPYVWEEGSYRPYSHFGMAFFPAGQLRTSARQLANFASLHLEGGRFDGRRLLKRKTVREMMRVQNPQVSPLGGLGFWVWEAEPWRFADHRGGFYGCSTYLVLELNHDLAVIVLTNGETSLEGTPRQSQAFQNIIDRLFREARRAAAIE